MAVHRGTSFCEVIYEGEKDVEGVVARLVSNHEEITGIWQENKVPLLIDPEASVKKYLHADVIVDAIMAKKNIGTRITDAQFVVGVGPGFKAGTDCHVVVETNNSENQRKIIVSGEAKPNTGIPLEIRGLTFKRVLRAPCDGTLRLTRKMGDIVRQNEIVAKINSRPVISQIDGVIRALLRYGTMVHKEIKLGEIDPRPDPELCYKIRPKMRTIAGGVLEAIMMYSNGVLTTN